MRCDNCGRFTRHTNDVWDSVAHQIDREVCDDCYRIIRRDHPMTTDPTPLQERIARAIHRSDEDEMDRLSGDFGDLAPHWQRMYLMNAAAVLPTIAAEVQAAKAEALRDAADSVHDNAASPYCLPCHRDDADLLRTIAADIERED